MRRKPRVEIKGDATSMRDAALRMTAAIRKLGLTIGGRAIPQCNLNEMPNTDRLDEVTRWAVWEEFALRRERYERRVLGPERLAEEWIARYAASLAGESK